MIRLAASIAVLAVVTLPRSLAAQDRPAEEPLEAFVDQVARLWASADVDALVQLLPDGTPLLLDAGSGIESANPRHFAATLRALFADHETVRATTARVSLATTDSTQGFGELTWTYRARGAPGEQARSIYVATRREDGGWTITELRLMP